MIRRLDERLLRLSLLYHPRRPSVLTSCLAAAQLCELVLVDKLSNADGHPRVSAAATGASNDLDGLEQFLSEHPSMDWDTMYHRGQLDTDGIYHKTVDRLVNAGVLQVPRTGWRRARPGWPIDLDPDEAWTEHERLAQAVEDERVFIRDDAIMIHLMAIAQASSWIPLTPGPSMDYVQSVAGLSAVQRDALHAILNGLINARHLATTSASLGDAGWTS